MNVYDYLEKSCILFPRGRDRTELLTEMARAACSSGKVSDKRRFEQAVMERESIMSTGIGLGVAVPHAKCPEIHDFFIVVAVLKDAADWDAIDGKPVRIVFLIGSPEGRQTDYLKLLSKIILLVKNQARREKIISSTTPEEVMAAFASV
jgi:PTS system nitrogen regulatory IIA component